MSSFGKLVTIEPTKGQVLKTVDLLERFGVQPNPPLYEDGMVYICSGAGAGGQMLALANDGLSVRPKWKDKMLDCQMHGLVSIDGYIYGTAQSGRGAAAFHHKKIHFVCSVPVRYALGARLKCRLE